jgi:hypothetical protein
MTATTIKNTNLTTLMKTVELIDRHSQQATDAIMGLVRTAQGALKADDAAGTGAAMDAIIGLARDSAAEIKAQATVVGCQDTAYAFCATSNAPTKVRDLQTAANLMDLYVQESASKIAGVAAVTKAAAGSGQLESLRPHLDNTLLTIHDMASTVQNLVNGTAEDVGSNYRRDAA